MSTFLQMVNQCRVEAGITSGDLSTLQTTGGNTLSAESTRFKNWVNNEWLRLQADKDQWQFLRKEAVFTSQALTAKYTPAVVGAGSTPTFTAAQFANWKRDSFRIYKSSDYSDEMLAGFINYDQWRNIYQYGSMRTNYSRPVAISVAPDKSLCLGMTPDSAGPYYVVFEYYQAPQGLSADTDTPTMPAQYHDLVVFRALRAYGYFMSAAEVVERANTEIARINPKLLADQLPVTMSGPPLA
jgi:hypothetical protein